jgi:hypothetical protein
MDANHMRMHGTAPWSRSDLRASDQDPLATDTFDTKFGFSTCFKG